MSGEPLIEYEPRSREWELFWEWLIHWAMDGDPLTTEEERREADDTGE
jgi:hypothetical protein